MSQLATIGGAIELQEKEPDIQAPLTKAELQPQPTIPPLQVAHLPHFYVFHSLVESLPKEEYVLRAARHLVNRGALVIMASGYASDLDQLAVEIQRQTKKIVFGERPFSIGDRINEVIDPCKREYREDAKKRVATDAGMLSMQYGKQIEERLFFVPGNSDLGVSKDMDYFLRQCFGAWFFFGLREGIAPQPNLDTYVLISAPTGRNQISQYGWIAVAADTVFALDTPETHVSQYSLDHALSIKASVDRQGFRKQPLRVIGVRTGSPEDFLREHFQ